LPNPKSLAGYFQVPTEHILKNYANLEMFIECQDSHGNTNPSAWTVIAKQLGDKAMKKRKRQKENGLMENIKVMLNGWKILSGFI